MISFCTAAENSDSNGYIRRDSPTRTTAMPLACSVVMFIQRLPLCRMAPRLRGFTGCLSCSRLS